MDQSFGQQHKHGTAAAALKLTGSHSPVLMDDVSGSGKKMHKYYEGAGRSAIPRLLVGLRGKKAGIAAGKGVQRYFPVCVGQRHCLPGSEKAACPPKRQTAFAYACGAKSGITGAAPGFSGVCVVSLRP